MSTQKRNLSDNQIRGYKGTSKWKIGILTAEWNPEVTNALRDAARKTLIQTGVKETNILSYSVPGSFELIKAAKWMAEKTDVDAVICLGCIIQGETRHFDFVAAGVTDGIRDLNIRYDIPVIFGVLTTNNQQQAVDRAGGKYGNKGDEAAAAALKMIQLNKELTSG
ncbi:MAG: 6,7-dimethyl-8-ribityllumazine synthase [Candidatus Delongbacteria bacterium]|jgi:6,7-dimethyl-8-ribityllumazine synthase|nr:6,7-dimethyl-8-ribityllumazine synthase [Candidatus Delongbacteria bacterium]